MHIKSTKYLPRCGAEKAVQRYFLGQGLKWEQSIFKFQWKTFPTSPSKRARTTNKCRKVRKISHFSLKRFSRAVWMTVSIQLTLCYMAITAPHPSSLCRLLIKQQTQHHVNSICAVAHKVV